MILMLNVVLLTLRLVNFCIQYYYIIEYDDQITVGYDMTSIFGIVIDDFIFLLFDMITLEVLKMYQIFKAEGPEEF